MIGAVLMPALAFATVNLKKVSIVDGSQIELDANHGVVTLRPNGPSYASPGQATIGSAALGSRDRVSPSPNGAN